MIFKERYKEILKTENEIKNAIGDDFEIENNIINDIRIVVIGHFGNCVGIQLDCTNICPLPLYNNTDNVGYIIRALIEIFNKENEDGANINCLKGTPIRIAYKGNKAVAIGHFMIDRFVFTEELMQLKV